MKEKLFKWMDQFTSKWIVFAIDLFFVFVSFVLAYMIRFNVSFQFDTKQLVVQIPFVLLVAAISFLIVGC